jgi:hypothetical protein
MRLGWDFILIALSGCDGRPMRVEDLAAMIVS